MEEMKNDIIKMKAKEDRRQFRLKWRLTCGDRNHPRPKLPIPKESEPHTNSSSVVKDQSQISTARTRNIVTQESILVEAFTQTTNNAE